MTPSSDLFHLIKSLKQTEKRYLKVYASKLSDGKAPQYMQLYKAIESMSEYDENWLKAHFKGKTFIRQLHVAKNYLTTIILQSLVAYYYDSSAHNSLALLLQTIEILYDKDQHHLCQKQIEKGIRLCKTYSKHNFLFIFLEWQTRLLIRRQDYDKALNAIEEQASILTALQQYLSAKERALKIHRRLITKGFPRTEDDINMLKEDMLDFAGSGHLTGALPEEAYYRLFALSNYYAGSGEQNKRAQTMKQLVVMLEDNMPYSLEHPHFYISALNNYYNALVSAGQIRLAKDVLRKIRNLSQKLNPKRHDTKNYALLVSYDIELEIAMLTNETHSVLKYVPEIKLLIDKTEGVFQKSTTLELVFNTARTLFVAGNYSEALDWVNRILNEKMSDAREDLNAAARILYLLIHYELGNDILLESIITSTKNSLKYKRRLFKAEQIVLNHLTRLNGAKKDKDRRVIFTSLT
ncbi:MAG TPA: hypothetical protein VK174_05855, partial [Chitinophagales bacterium]|nr:hypothetical protein [Chitinophagales bacterium]